MLSVWQFAVVVLREKLTALEESNDALAKRIQRLRESIEDEKSALMSVPPAGN